MGLRSRRKGQRGEREAAEALAAIGVAARRTGQTCGTDAPDVETALPGVHVEVKRCERLNLSQALGQATRDAGPCRTPIVVHRANGKPWMVTLRLSDLPRLARAVVEALAAIVPPL
ncbi:MAG: hypothetical protein GX595_17340 [Lentisphaerae bacterium]|nr:hypothetical protein [Lentisphaerota bacterium]